MIPRAHLCAPVDDHALPGVTAEFGAFVVVGLGTDGARTLVGILARCTFVVVAAYPGFAGIAGRECGIVVGRGGGGGAGCDVCWIGEGGGEKGGEDGDRKLHCGG